MSFFEDASLVYIPAAIKNGKTYSIKPTDGTGDLTFTRASSATRVGPNGYIEKVRTNILFPSNDWVFNTASGSATNNTTANPLDGAVTAATLTGLGFWGTSKSAAGIHTMSVFVKAGSVNAARLNIYNGTTDIGVYFSLVDGSVTSEYGTNVNRGSVNIGNGWWRLYLAVNCTSALYAQLHVDSAGTIIAYGLQGEAGDVMTDYIATSGSAVSVGPVSGTPRLDYLGSDCGRLLLEPQRSNSQINSENFAAWLGIDNVTIGSNTTDTLDPSGYYGADKVTIGSGSPTRVYEFSGSSAGSGTISLFVKSGTSSILALFTSSSSLYCLYNLSTQSTSPSAGTTASITNYGNGWYRITATATLGSNEVLQIVFSGSVGQTMYIWGAQLEAGAYATSYIPTLGTAVTRVEDTAITASVPSLIGQTEGTMFVEMTRDNVNETFFVILSANAGTTSNSYQNSVYFFQLPNGGGFVCDIFVSNSAQFSSNTTALSVGKHKLAIAYKQNDFALYVDGVQRVVDTSGNVPAMNYLTIAGGADVGNERNIVSQTLLFKTRLTNAQLAELTTL